VVVEIFNFKAGGFIWQMGCALRGSVHVTGLTSITTVDTNTVATT
jgi:hypothetical protein